MKYFILMSISICCFSCTESKKVETETTELSGVSTDHSLDSQKSSQTTNHSETPEFDDANVFSVAELIGEVQSDQRDVSLSTLVKGGTRVKVSGVIVTNDTYRYNSFREEYEPRLELERAVPATLDIECEFSKPAQIEDLVIGQTVVISGELAWSFPSKNSKTFSLKKCNIESSEPAPGSGPPKFSLKEIPSYREDGENLIAAYEALKNAGIAYSDIDKDDLNMDIEIHDDSVDASGKLSQAAIQAINSVPIIETLDAGYVGEIPTSAAIELGQVKYCERLNIKAGQLEQAGFEALLSIPGFRRLSIWYPNKLNADGFAAFANCPQVLEFNLLGNHGNQLFQGSAGEALSHIAKMPRIRKIWFSSVDATDNDLAFLKKLPHLHEVEFSDLSISGKGFEYLANPEAMWNLNCSGNSITNDIAVPLQRMTNLFNLTLVSEKITGDVGKGFTGLGNLTRIDLSESGVGNDIGPWLNHLKNLTSLNLGSTSINDEIIIPIADMVNLTRIDLSETEVGSGLCEQLGASKSLKEIYLDETSIDDDALAKLATTAKDSNLELVSLKKTKVTHQGLIYLLTINSLKKIKVDAGFELSENLKKAVEENDNLKIQLGGF